MNLNSDYKDLLSEFLQRQIKFLVVGGYAVMLYSEPRYTKDLDILIKADKENGRPSDLADLAALNTEPDTKKIRREKIDRS